MRSEIGEVVDLLDHNDMVIALAGMLLHDQKIAIDPVDEESAGILAAAGYRVVKADEFRLAMLLPPCALNLGENKRFS